MLLAFRASLPDLKGKEPPKRLLVAKWGKNESVRGPFTVNETTARMLPAVQRVLGFDTVAIDFEHNTVPGTPEYEKAPEPRHVAAHGVPRVIPGDGLYIEEIRWTPEGEASVRGGHHPDLSPAVKANDKGEVVLLHSAAMCRQGSCLDLQVFNAALTATQLQLYSATLSTSPENQNHAMNHKELLCLLLGLDAHTATDVQIADATKTFASRINSAIGVAGQVATFSATVDGLKTSLQALQTKLDTAEREALVAEALRDGKLVPHNAEIDKLSNAQFKAVLEALPAGIVPLAQRTPELVKTFSAPNFSAGGGGGNDATDDAVRRQLGISEDDWKKA